MPADELCSDDFRDFKKILVVQDLINVFSDFWVSWFGFLGLLIFGLQFLQLQSHATDAGCIKIFFRQLGLEQVPKLPQLE